MHNPYQHQPPTAPWDDEPTGVALLKLRLFVFGVLFPLILGAITLLAASVLGFSEFFSPYHILLMFPCCLLVAGAIWILRCIFPALIILELRCLGQTKLQRLHTNNTLYLYPMDTFWELKGASSVVFNEDEMQFSERPKWREHTDYAMAGLLTVIAAVVATAWQLNSNFELSGLLILGIEITVVCVIATILTSKIHRWIGVNTSPGILRLVYSDIKRVTCKGPIIHIRFSNPKFKWMSNIVFYIAQDHREDFFTQFNQTFPGHLPPEYRDALPNTTPPTPDTTPTLTTAHP